MLAVFTSQVASLVLMETCVEGPSHEVIDDTFLRSPLEPYCKSLQVGRISIPRVPPSGVRGNAGVSTGSPIMSKEGPKLMMQPISLGPLGGLSHILFLFPEMLLGVPSHEACANLARAMFVDFFRGTCTDRIDAFLESCSSVIATAWWPRPAKNLSPLPAPCANFGTRLSVIRRRAKVSNPKPEPC